MRSLINENVLFIIHYFSCLFMTGVIWVIQMVHYPSFFKIGKNDFADFIAFHGKHITLIVAPFMVIEFVSGVLLVFVNNRFDLWIFNLGAIIGIWLSTFLLSVPCHQRLMEKRDLAEIQKLIKTNWPRTILWSVRSLLLSLVCLTL